MKKLFLSLCILASALMNAQEVDKATVQKQADAAQSAGAGLKSVDTGDKAWKFSGVVGLNAAATGLVNWAAGGNNNVNGVVYGRFRLLYHKNNFAWDTNLDTEYGMSWIDQPADAFQKSSDKLAFTTKFGWEFKPKWYLTVLGGFNTQFAYGRAYEGTEAADPIISKFLAPAYTDISVGIDWKPNDIFSVYLSPLAGRFTTVHVGSKLLKSYEEEFHENLEMVLKDKYAVVFFDDNNVKSYQKNTRAEFGLSLKGNVNYAYKDLKVQTSLGLFTPYAMDKVGLYDYVDGGVTTRYTEKQMEDKHIAIDDPNATFVGYRDNNRRIGHFDVDWTVALSYQFLKCLQVTVSTDLRYYNGVLIANKDGLAKERCQFKGILGLGVGYSF